VEELLNSQQRESFHNPNTTSLVGKKDEIVTQDGTRGKGQEDVSRGLHLSKKDFSHIFFAVSKFDRSF
jgi:hypothetical protein